MIKKFICCLSATALVNITLCAQSRIETIPFGDMNKWMTRTVEESFIIGGQTKKIYELSSPKDFPVNTAYVPNIKVSPWATSSVYAKVSGVIKSSTTVFPEEREKGNYAARLETRLETCKVLGLINITVLASGTLFLGEVVEPIKDTKNPQAKLMMGIPFDKRPSSVIFDYKFKQGINHGKRIKVTGFSKEEKLDGENCAEVCLLLHKRWEKDGVIYAKRIGTAWARYNTNSNSWILDNKVNILYGDITSNPLYKDYMNIINEADRQYCRNSKGEISPVVEVGWGEPDDTPTHIVLRFSSSHGGAYIGAPGSTMWVDNIKLGYNN